ncbi:MAG TPA: ABC transporter, partial [Armatimonadetes bacterium]|nr:ABC transporter [Armatimonadota bacterium]
MRGMRMGPDRTIGGMQRTFGLHRQFGEEGERPERPITMAEVRRVFGYFMPYWGQWLIILLCIAATSGLGVLPPLCVRAIIDEAIPSKNADLLHLMVGAIVALTLVSGLISVLQNYLNALVGQGIMYDLRNELYGHLQRQSLGFYTTTRAGEIVSRLNNDVAAVNEVATGTVVQVASHVFTLVATLIVIFGMNPWLALLAIAVVPTFYLPTRIVGRIRHRLSRQTQEEQAELVSFMEERLNIGGMVLAKIFGQSAADANYFARRNRSVMDLNVKQTMAGRWLFMVLSVFSVIGPAAIYLYGGHQAIREELTVGTLIAFVAYLTNLYRPIGGLANVYVAFQGALAVFQRIFDYLDRSPDVEDRPGASALAGVRGSISLEGVYFAYPRADAPTGGANGEPPPERRWALENVSFEIEAGQRVALVGPSGAGKTTITYLLPRFYDPTEGRVTLDGHDLRDIAQESLRSHFGVVTQDTFLFHTSVRENLLYARPSATEDEMVSACRSANIHELISDLPEEYGTIVGERGFRLSGGEKQRLAIARALLKDPRILILDE